VIGEVWERAGRVVAAWAGGRTLDGTGGWFCAPCASTAIKIEPRNFGLLAQIVTGREQRWRRSGRFRGSDRMNKPTEVVAIPSCW
jgi:hypothetical protein